MSASRQTSADVTHIRDLTPAFCSQWYRSWNYSNTTMQARWNVVRSFNQLHQQGQITVNRVISIKAVPRGRTFNNVPLSGHQYNDILNAVGRIGDSVAKSRDTKVYRERLHIFIELLRWTGMDTAAMRFSFANCCLMLTECCGTSARRRGFKPWFRSRRTWLSC